jgi:hypothetical protein
MKKHLKLLVCSVLVALTFASPWTLQGMEPEPAKEFPFQRGTAKIPTEIVTLIVKFAAINNYLSNDHIVPLKLVCKEWRDIINKDFVDDAIQSAYELLGYGEIYQRFLNGALVYMPQEGSDVGMVTLPIAALRNPLEDTFDLSRCGDAGNYLSISTGYRKVKRAENAEKLEVWFAPRFLIAKEINKTAKHFQGIMSDWKDSAEVGIFWTWGGWDNLDSYDYLTTENMDDLSKNGLYGGWCTAIQHNATDPSVVKTASKFDPRLIWRINHFLARF